MLFPEKADIRDNAINWLVKLEDGEWAELEKSAFLEWLESDPRHRSTFLEVANFWGEMDMLAVLTELTPEKSGHSASNAKISRGSPWQWMFAASTCVLILLVGWLLLPFAPETFTAATAETSYQTRIGEQTRAVLQDGSVIMLNTASQAIVKFSENERAVWLDNGEAFFEVSKDTQRPFRVYAGKGRITAVGTAFNVRIDKDNVDVMVSEGTVEVVAGIKVLDEGDSVEKPQAVTLQEKGLAEYTDVIESSRYLESGKLNQKLAWKSGKLVFDGETLEEVIAEINRYTSENLKIADPSIAGLRIGGQFNAGDQQQLLNMLKGSFGIKVIKTDNKKLYLASSSFSGI